MGYYILNLRQSISESVRIRVIEDAGKSGGKIPSSWAVADTILGGFIGFNVGAIAGALIGVDIAYGGFGIGSAIGAGLLVGTITIAEYFDVMPNNFHIFGITSGEFNAGLDFKKRQDEYAIDLTQYYKSLEEIKQQKITYEDSDDSFEREKAEIINESVYLQDNPEMLQLEMMQIKALLYEMAWEREFMARAWDNDPRGDFDYDYTQSDYISDQWGETINRDLPMNNPIVMSDFKAHQSWKSSSPGLDMKPKYYYDRQVYTLGEGSLTYYDTGDKDNSYGFFAIFEYQGANGLTYKETFGHMERPCNVQFLLNHGTIQVNNGYLVGTMGNTGGVYSNVDGKYEKAQLVSDSERADGWGTHLHYDKYYIKNRRKMFIDPME